MADVSPLVSSAKEMAKGMNTTQILKHLMQGAPNRMIMTESETAKMLTRFQYVNVMPDRFTTSLNNINKNIKALSATHDTSDSAFAYQVTEKGSLQGEIERLLANREKTARALEEYLTHKKSLFNEIQQAFKAGNITPYEVNTKLETLEKERTAVLNEIKQLRKDEQQVQPRLKSLEKSTYDALPDETKIQRSNEAEKQRPTSS